MKLLRLYFRRSPGLAVLAIVAGGLSGGATAWLLSIINTVLTGPAWSSHLVAAFVGLCLLRLVSGIVSHLLLIRLSQTAILHLRLELCDHILRAPLRFIESLGPHRLTACFTDDVANVSNIVINIPYFLINLVVLAACLTYLASLSMPAFAAVVSGLLIGVATYLGPVLWANRHFRLAREQQDALFAHFRSVTEGTKELKLHVGRRQRFTDALLRAAARRLHHHNVAGISI
jgi:putative ATP-binding cassette transporter